ncbi:hypothetical protein [Bradyrhizobium sp. Ce-3]|uniref:hypothetical protein n=1 Tax=Bradyrhizobium sp. Ce-3 TaxID=2913970 RepID=UPI001FC8A492|nr:hypothetical protein [Bradyrhizobium sp. Ce-3]
MTVWMNSARRSDEAWFSIASPARIACASLISAFDIDAPLLSACLSLAISRPGTL